MNITGMSDQWVAALIKQKGDSKCIPWKSLKDLILTHPDVRKRVDVFALSIYGLVVFLKALGHVDEAVTDLFEQFDKRVTPIPIILVKTFRSLSTYRKAVFSKSYSPLKEIVVIPRRDDISEEKWMAILQNLQKEDIEWRAPWLLSDEILYRCGNFDWVPLLGIWGAIGYALLLVLRQYRLRQFIPATQGIADCEFLYIDDGYRKTIQEISTAWKQTRRMKRLAMSPMTTLEYNEWWVRRINDNRPKINLEKKIEQMEEKKMNLRLDIDVQKLETKKLRKGKNKAEEELDSLKTDYKKLRLSMRTVGLGKTSE
ncbi:hypothetical protein Godav_025973 [Gossypium davidsonii]|uniref:DUF7745 domain-containing protein n=1 Tax=Gossypium davidsonii TaxID=34287 RepID=A0A7J8TAX0_GOSDV|nr:hypothetical protein [Gossypium davidsonii]